MWRLTKRETQEEIVENCKDFIVRDVCISTAQRMIEHAIVDKADPQFSRKMFKSERDAPRLME